LYDEIAKEAPEPEVREATPEPSTVEEIKNIPCKRAEGIDIPETTPEPVKIKEKPVKTSAATSSAAEELKTPPPQP
jgi:hypothetical protein